MILADKPKKATNINLPMDFWHAGHAPDLCPIVSIGDVQYFLDTPQMAAITLSELKKKAGTLQPCQLQIMTALDRVLGTC